VWLGRHPDPQTRRSYRGDLAAFYLFALDANLVAVDPVLRIPAARVPTRLPRPLSDDAVAVLLGHARTVGPPRTLAWVLLMAYAGLRSCEVASTGPERLTGRRLFLPVCKGGGQGWVTLPEWVALEVAAVEPWAPIGAKSVQRTVSHAMTDAGVTGTPHQLRHWFGTTSLRACGNLRIVQGLMRHASPATTALYTLVEDSERSAVVDSLPQLGAVARVTDADVTS